MYSCRVLRPKNQKDIQKDEIVSIQENQLSKYINIKVKVLESESF
jgi:hypothetical protein